MLGKLLGEFSWTEEPGGLQSMVSQKIGVSKHTGEKSQSVCLLRFREKPW